MNPEIHQSALTGAVPATLQLCTLRIAERWFGFDILDVKEINRETKFTHIHHASREVVGFVNIRGQIYLVLDLSRMLGFAPADVGESSRIVIFKPHVGPSFGVLVDRIGDIVPVAAEQIEERHSETDGGPAERARTLIRGECKLADKLVVLLRAEAMLPTLQRSA